MKKITLILFIFIVGIINAQDFNSSFFIDPSINKNDSTKLFLRVENTNFFKNDEYFGDLTSGITYIGTYIQPKLVYQPYSKIKIQAGIHLLKYSGLEVLSQALPVFSFQYSPNKDLSFIMGAINGGANHRIMEPLYAFENHLINNLESGAQLLWHKSNFDLDIWVNWEEYILKTSNAQESILGGIHVNYLLLETKNKANLKLDFQTIIAHKGGEFHSDGQTLQTIVNTATGLQYSKKTTNSKVKSFGADVYYVSYTDPSPIPQYPYLKGYAVSASVFAEAKWFYVNLGYWTGEYFISSRGSQLFMSISDKKPDFTLPRTELLTVKLAFRKQVYKDIMFEARFEPYYNIMQRNFEYSYSFYFIFNRDFFLRSIK